MTNLSKEAKDNLIKGLSVYISNIEGAQSNEHLASAISEFLCAWLQIKQNIFMHSIKSILDKYVRISPDDLAREIVENCLEW